MIYNQPIVSELVNDIDSCSDINLISIDMQPTYINCTYIYFKG